MKDFKDYTFEDFQRVPRIKTAAVTLAKQHHHTAFKVKSCTISLNDGVHGSRSLTEVFK